ncbi:helix-turn-helix domain-containing protein [Streptomyces sp. NPDC056749]|uniref:helix-turn-helix domain-containing protein n=1 Tax=Streptomyces sp. NPDC056749 TaxID=3345936 RepID=UPI0036AC0D46
MGHLGDLLQGARKRAGMTQRQLADLATVSVRAIRDMELGRTKNPHRETIRLLVDALQMNRARQIEIETAAGLRPKDHAVDDFWSQIMPPSAPLGPIIGREQEIATLTGRLESGSHRMVTVVGVPGVGKTRLNQEIARRIHAKGIIPVLVVEASTLQRRRSSPDGNWMRDSLTVLLHSAVDCQKAFDQLVSVIGDKQLILVVNGHTIDAIVPNILLDLLNRCCGLRVLLEASNINEFADDVVYSLSPLAVQDDSYASNDLDSSGYPAIDLLLSRYIWLRADSVIDSKRRGAIASVCRRLDGIPGALESAARWLMFYEPDHLQEIAANSPGQLTASLNRTDQDVFYSLSEIFKSLDQSEMVVIRSLATLHRPWTVDEALSVLRDKSSHAMSEIHRLRVRGLIRQVASIKSDDRPRFMVLNLIQHICQVL